MAEGEQECHSCATGVNASAVMGHVLLPTIHSSLVKGKHMKPVSREAYSFCKDADLQVT